MKHSDIATETYFAAKSIAEATAETCIREGQDSNAVIAEVYDYCRARNFPKAETLARKVAEISGHPFPWQSIEEAPEPTRVFYEAYRAIAQVLEPFHEPDPEEDHAPGAAPAKNDPAGAGGTETDAQTQEPDDGNGTGGETPPAADPKAGKSTAAPSDQPDEAGRDPAADAGGKDAQGATEEAKVTGDKAAGAAKKDDKK